MQTRYNNNNAVTIQPQSLIDLMITSGPIHTPCVTPLINCLTGIFQRRQPRYSV